MKFKSLLLTLAMFLLLGGVFGQVVPPKGFTYQAAVRNPDNGEPIAGQLDMRFTILRNSNILYQEVETLTPTPFGIINHVVGDGIPIPGGTSIGDVDWSLDNIVFRVEIDADNTGQWQNMGTTLIQSVPYAIYADKARTVENATFPLDSLLNVNISSPTNGDVLRWDNALGQWVNGTASGGIVSKVGPGLQLINDSLVNTGDTNALDDITILTPAGGDLAGTYPDPQVTGILGNKIEVSSSLPLDSGYVLKWNPDSLWWEPRPDNVASGGGAGSVNVANRLKGDGTIANPLDLAKNGASLDQVLKWDGAAWSPADEEQYTIDLLSGSVLVLQKDGNTVNAIPLPGGNNFTAGAGIDITGNIITNTGDTNAADDITDTDQAGGDVSGTFTNISVNRIEGFDVDLSTLTDNSILRFDAASLSFVAEEDFGFTDLDRDPSQELQSLTLTGFDLTLNKGGGTVTLPSYTAGNGIQILGTTVIQNTGDLDGSDDIKIGDPAGQDLSGFYPLPQVVGIRGRAIEVTPPTEGQILQFTAGNTWAPVTLDSAGQLQNLFLDGDSLGLTNSTEKVAIRYQGGAGITVDNTNMTITNSGDVNAGDDVLQSDPAGGDVSGVFNNLTVERIQNVPVTSSTPSNGNILKYNSGVWVLSSDAVNDPDNDPDNEIQTLSISGNDLTLSQGGGTVDLPVYTGGTGIDITNNIITNTGDTDANDDVLDTDPAGGDISGTFSNLTVESLQGQDLAGNAPSTSDVLKWNGLQWEAAIDSVNDNDADSTNEIQTLNFSGGILTLSDGGGSVVIPDDVVDSDADPTNEFQELLIVNNDLTIFPSGNTISLYSAGAGIDVSSGRVITNTGDLDPSDDITDTSIADGDVTGTFDNLIVEGIQQIPVSTTTPIVGQVLKYNGTEWVPTADLTDDGDTESTNEIQELEYAPNALGDTVRLTRNNSSIVLQPYVEGTGIDITNKVVTNTGDTDASDDIIDTTPSGGDISGVFSNVTVQRIQNRAVSTAAPSTNEVLKWSGTEWEPTVDAVDDADADATNEIQTISYANDSLTISDGNTIFIPDSVEDDDADASNELQTLSISGSTLTISSGNSVTVPVTTYSAGTGIDITGTTITNTGDTDASDDITDTSNSGGDVSGVFSNMTVEGLQGRTVSSAAPSTSEVLKWSGTEWEPATDAVDDADADATNEIQTITYANDSLTISDGNTIFIPDSVEDDDADASNELQTLSISGSTLTISSGNSVTVPVTTYSAGTGIDITGTTITNIGDTDASDDVTDTSNSGGDVSGVFSNMTVEGLQGRTVSSAAPSTSEVLKWSGTEWEPATDAVDDADADATNEIQTISYANDSLTISDGNTIFIPDSVEDDDADASNELQTLSISGSTLTISSGNSVTVPVTTYSAGTGIDITGTTITNIGDTDASDDITDTSNSGGDVSGVFSNMTVEGLQGRSVSTAAPSSNEVLKWSGTEWEPATDEVNDADASTTNELQSLSISGTTLSITSGNSVTIPTNTYTGGTGIGISGNTIINLGDTDASDDITDTSNAGGDVDGVFSSLNVNAIQGNDVESGTPTALDVLQWDGAQWALTEDNDQDTTNELQSLSIAGNLLTISDGNTITLPGALGISAGTGISVNGSNVITNIGDTDSTNDVTITTNAGGDVDGVFSSLNVNAIQGNAVEAGSPTTLDVLQWDGSQWALTQDLDQDTTNEQQQLAISGTTLSISGSTGNSVALPYVGGTGIALSGATIVNTGDTDPSDDIVSGDAATGDLSGTYPDPTVAGIQGNPVSSSAPNTSEVLKWNGSQWEASADSVDDADASVTNELQSLSISGTTLSISSGNSVTVPVNTYTAGTGIDVTGTVITNTGDTDASDDITDTSNSGGDISGVFSNITVEGIQGVDVAATAPLTSQVLRYNGAEWVPASDSVDDADASTTNELQSLSLSGRDLTISSGNTITLPDSVDDDDADATNELQTLSISGTTLSISDRNSVTIPVNTYTGGTGIDVTGTVITNTGDTDASDDITDISNAGGDVSGTFSTLTVEGLQGNDVANTTPLTNEVLKWNGSEWEPDTDAVDDADASTTNELQTLSISGNTLTLSSGNSVTIPTISNVYTGGPGIDVTGTTITNTGDRDSTNDVLITDNAGGDLSGVFSNLTVEGLQGVTVSSTAPTSSQVLRYDGTEWVPSDDDADATNELQTLSLTGEKLSISSSTDSVDLSGFVLATETVTGDLSGTFASPTVDGLQGRALSANAPSVTEVLKWNGAEWIPSADSVNDDDADATNELQTLSLTGQKLSISSSTDSVDLSGFLLGTATVTGDLNGSITAPTVDGLQGRAVAATAPTATQVLKWNGITWTPAADSVNDDDADATNELQTLSLTGEKLSISSSTDSVDLSGFLLATETVSGDLSGTFAAPSVNGLQGRALSANAPAATEVLKWNGAEWIPSADSVNDADANATNELQDLTLTGNLLSLTNSSVDLDISSFLLETESPSQGDLTGTYDSLVVSGIKGTSVADVTPETGEVLFYDGSDWTPDSLSTASLLYNADLVPTSASTVDLGSASNPLDSIFVTEPLQVVSDARLKKDIEPIAYGLEEILNLNPVSYHLKHNDPNGNRQLGLLAQDVEGVIGEAVGKYAGSIELPDGTRVENGHYTISYTKLIPVIIKGIQEQQEAINKQDQIIEQQAEMIELLRKQLEILQQQEENDSRD